MGNVVVGLQTDRDWTADELSQEGTGFKLGDIVTSFDGQNTYMFVEADSAITTGKVVGISTDFGSAHLTKAMADAGRKIGVAVTDIASGSFGFVLIKGQTAVSVLASCAAAVPLYTSATGGSLDDTATSQTLINGIKLLATNGGATANVSARIAVEPFAD